ncbi:hypothetical protein BO70DRAFT_161250 [Aspergillus heteromorphus CBS 117.55]|uniref:Uncharacterized protein n=1 Tax=Aspergillus heteromorphus CBS 117.55 TaxID=1448321 RepID=A0A317WV50_9EURO|nr:uncharacterized protein BO70DRAFT_161250 [Aspergillus heteromorphus CBS 117.55]PWY89097.1 hypothetical protein BO70DRAFT_161250 [Aspergillus heteromorphus CBS 117.55]
MEALIIPFLLHTDCVRYIAFGCESRCVSTHWYPSIWTQPLGWRRGRLFSSGVAVRYKFWDLGVFISPYFYHYLSGLSLALPFRSSMDNFPWYLRFSSLPTFSYVPPVLHLSTCHRSRCELIETSFCFLFLFFFFLLLPASLMTVEDTCAES